MRKKFLSLCIACLIAGCRITDPNWCFHIEYGDCSGASGETADSVRVIGFPREHVDSTGQGLLHVGESVNLSLLILANAQHYPGDTSHTARWSAVATSAGARVTTSGNGTGVLTAIAPGTITAVIVDGVERPIWSYTNGPVIKLTRIVITP